LPWERREFSDIQRIRLKAALQRCYRWKHQLAAPELPHRSTSSIRRRTAFSGCSSVWNVKAPWRLRPHRARWAPIPSPACCATFQTCAARKGATL